MKLADLTPDTRNANKGTARGRKLVRESLKRYGAGRSILLDKHGAIIAGNKTAEAAGAVGMEDVQIVKSDGSRLVAVQRTDLDINDKAARELAIADNRASEIGLEWDVDILKQFEHEEVDLSPFWDERELVSFFARPGGEAPEPKLDQAEALRQKWETKRGQIWEIGKHRLMCGDSTSEDDLFVLLRPNSEMDAVVTDPPYGVGVDYESFRDTPTEVAVLVHKIVPIMRRLAPVVLLTSGIPSMWIYPKPDWLLAWVHPAATSSGPWGFCGLNPILAYGHDPYLAAGLGRRHDVCVEVADREGVEGHPAPKPAKVWSWLVERATTKPGQRVFDPFSGSGTTLACCESLKRTCYALEIEPKYVAVALERLSDMGLTPELKHG